ncbi:MAG TPA: nicotinamide riboside transporter PnuC [Vicinamibacterales bacterium]|nr:nicotinamide riboside transporter PnuC [Vicinamibacterales bacterium]
MSPLEIVAVICGLLNIYLTVKQNIWSWAFGAVMVSLYIYITYDARLYSDALLNVFFLVMQFYGWYEWTRGPVVHARSLSAVKRLGTRGWSWTTAGVIGGTAALGTAMQRYTNASLPYLDASATALSVFGQFLMTKKYLDNWTLWIIADVLYVFLIYPRKGLYLTAGLYVVFLILCVQGYREWSRNDNYTTTQLPIPRGDR